jgi:hypothetical protein
MKLNSVLCPPDGVRAGPDTVASFALVAVPARQNALFARNPRFDTARVFPATR